MNQPPLDLSQLAIDRQVGKNELDDSMVASGRQNSRYPRRTSKWVSRVLLPGAILTGFVVMLAMTAGRQLLPKTAVSVTPVIVRRGEAPRSATPLFQAAGWIEPRPTSVSVPSLASGVIEELMVIEGQLVEKEEVIARLIDVDAKIAIDQAKARLALRESECQRAEAELRAARARLEKPLHLKTPLTEAQSLLAKALTERETLPFEIQTAQANVDYTRSSLEGKQDAGAAIATVVIRQAQRDFAAAKSKLEERRTRGINLDREIEALRARLEVLSEQLELLIEERRQVAEAEAKVGSAHAVRDEAKLELKLAELTLQRTKIRAPISGRILQLVALPGTRVSGLQQSSGHQSSTVVEMYDPSRLQVRADVRLEDLPLVTPGAPVKIETASSKESIEGRVLQPTSSANIQKNTLEVKVEILAPPETLRPEMLVTATFLAPELVNRTEPLADARQIFVPKSLVRSGDEGDFVWIVDSENKAIRRVVETGASGDDGLILVTSGLMVTDKLISSHVETIRDGAYVTLRGEDLQLGVE
ncbi:efflux RND transporter periplasmic adaptor subunit [Roseiconus lacunae]|uniref:Efflux RND transporter periplasmic adaptor subunit n=1 Tax=Roseiconus lacunae TaxID=2605694 RepID=A0ABT7PPM8_9BACT|nr:efflux RND transporter periplasmic adaptor subunit [Roseiconus lacunae]MDM4018293.1 efflux RND transporter periplasmic adaptor subunit [Roseiconus lacunae]